MKEHLCLVSCVGQKRRAICAARDMYTSAWFRKASTYAAQLGDWMILSARHGLLSPDEIIEPYEQSLNTMKADERMAWAAEILDLQGDLLKYKKIIFLAGLAYREHLIPALSAKGIVYSVPMEGLAIGLQLQWLDQHIRPNPGFL